MIEQLHTNRKTFLGRYWHPFTVLRRYLAQSGDLNILSFGCSTGEELLTLRALFPTAKLTGCDVDPEALLAARALLGDEADVVPSNEAELTPRGPYDVIVCNSVLMRSTRPVGGRKLGLQPQLWIDTVALLDGLLKPGGIFQIINSNFPFRYHPLARGYHVLHSPLIFGPNFVDMFDLEGRHLCTGIPGAGWSAMLTRHLGEEHWAELRATDFQDIHFCKAGAGNPPPPVTDEIIPLPLPQTDKSRASGTMTYRPAIPIEDSKPSTYLEVDVAWEAPSVDAIRLERKARRIWFDGATAWQGRSIVEMSGPAATAFIEASTGQRSTRLAMDTAFDSGEMRRAVRSESF